MQLVERRPIGVLQSSVDQGAEVIFAELICAPEFRDAAFFRAPCLWIAVGVDDLQVGARTRAGDLQLYAMTLSGVDTKSHVLQSAFCAITRLPLLPLAKC